MESLRENLNEYRIQLEKGSIQKAYRGLMEYIMELKSHFLKKFPDYDISGNIYYGYMDMTYFSIFPKSIKDKKLKIAVVFLHEAFRFEVWLCGVNKQVQKQYYELIKESGWEKYKLVPQEKGIDSIIEHILTDSPDFVNKESLTKQIEAETLNFIEDVERLILKN